MRRRRALNMNLLAIAVVLTILSAGCGGSGGPPGGSWGGPELVDGGVIFRYFDPDAAKVHVVGDFNNWSASSDPMVDKNGDGEWTLFYNLAPGRYEYKFVVDGSTWIPDPRNQNTVPDGFEGRNSLLVVPELGS
jgi:hypothetical protein